MIQKFQKAERIFIPIVNENKSTENLKNFIIDNFQIPDDDLERICEFIRKDGELEQIIFKLPRIIQNEISYNKLQIKFFDEFQDDELVLEVTAFSSLEYDKLLDIEDDFIHKLYDEFEEESVDKIIIFIEG